MTQIQTRLLFLPVCLLLAMGTETSAAELLIYPASKSVSSGGYNATKPGQIPLSRVARGKRDITSAWLAGATDRYPHGVLGDELEGSRLVVETPAGNRLQVDLPRTRVFEDLEPRLVDLDKDGRDEIIVVESDTGLGASLAVYGIISKRLVRKAATPFLGRPNRWLNPLGVGDFNGDGQLDIALVATPHIGGNLRLYQFKQPHLSLFAEYSAVSTHRIGSTELGLGQVIRTSPRDQFLVPDQSRRSLMVLEWRRNGWLKIAEVKLPGYLGSSLRPLGDNRWHFTLENRKAYEIQLSR